MRPGLVLAYNSSAKSGQVGVGWDLQGIGSLQRNTKWGLNYNGDDYVYNSSAELVYKGATSGGGREYMAKIEGSFLRYVKYSDGKWVVTDKSGTAYTYGDSPATRQEHPSGGVFKWMLSMVQDTHGNSMTFSYLKDQGEIYIDRIEWTGGSAKFYWEARPDVPAMYTANYSIKTAWRLKTVDVTAYGQRVGTYALAYKQSAGTNRSLLTSVQQLGVDATVDSGGTVTGGTALPPVSLTWQEAPESGTFGFSWICQTNCGDIEYEISFGDFNGDGKTDIFYHSSTSTLGSHLVRLSNGDGTFNDIMLCQNNCGLIGFLAYVGDFNGDGKSDLVFYNRGTGAQAVWLSNGDGTFSSTWICQDSCSLRGYPLVGDFNGDGKTDLFFYDRGSGTQELWLSKGDGTFLPIPVCPTNCNASGFTLLVGDFNGDGKSDLFFYDYVTGFYLAKLSNGDGTFGDTWICQDNCNMSGYMPVLGDFNSDGNTDIFFYNRGTGEQVVRLSNGDGTFGYISVCSTNCNFASFVPLSGDFNGDAKTDILFSNSATGEQVLKLSNGDGGFDVKLICNDGCSVGHGVYPGDFNGDGKTDIYFYRKSPGSHVVGFNQGPFPDLVTVIGNSLGGTQTIAYRPSSAYSNALLPFIVQTVSSVTANDGYGLDFTTRYAYAGGFYSFDEREFRGFRYSRATDLTGAYTENWFHQDDQKKGLVWHADAFDGAGALMAKTSYTYDVTTPAAGVTRRDLSTKYVETYDGGSSSKTVYTGYAYDSYGNVQTMTVSDPANGTIAARTTYTDYVYDPSAYIVDRASHTTTIIGGTKVSEAWFDYDGHANGVAPTKGDLTRQTNWLSGGSNPVTRYFYDSYGNRIGTIEPEGNVCASTGYSVKTDYDAVHQIFPVRVTNALCQQTTSTYWGVNTTLSAASVSGAYIVPGQPATATDANGVVTESYWDFMGRPRATVVPPDTASAPTTLALHVVTGVTGTFPSMTVTSKRETAGGGTLDTIAYLDGLGRVIQTKSEAEVSGQWITVDTTYNNRGMVETVSIPYLTSYQAGPTGLNAFSARDASQPKTTTYYDHVRRPTWVINPDGTSSATTYHQWVVAATDEKGATTVTTSDALGRLILVQEPSGGGTTVYSYDIVDPLGNSTRRINDAQGNIFETITDTLGRKTSQVDPDLGTWRYAYDLNGNLRTQTDAKGQTITLAYDNLNRITTKTYPDARQIAYTYDSGCTYCVGRIRQVTDPSGSTAFTYDQRGQSTQVDKVVGASTHTIQSLYDSMGRVVDMTYPDGEVVRHAYNAQGLLDKLSSATYATDYVSNLDYNVLGKVTNRTIPNGRNTAYAYDPWSFRLTSLSTAGNLQNLAYAYDAVGNITSLTDSVKAGTQSFGYDLLNRLTSASSGAAPAFAHSYVYDAIGNVTFGAGKTLAYPAAGSPRPHAPTSDGSCSYTYDANGNMATRTCSGVTRAYSWDYDNRLTRVTEGTATLAEFAYDYSGARVRKVEGNTTTVYPFSHYKVANGSVTKYYFANGGRVAERVGPAATDVYYYHPDHLGSSNVVTDSSGTEVKATLFYPYGSTRTESGAKEIIHKYTGKEVDASTGLYDYGARYYEPGFMHFISADSIVPNAGDPQSLNRYAYVRNNPIRLIDPTGHAEETFEAKLAEHKAWLNNDLNRWLDAVNAARDWANYAADQNMQAAMIKNQMIKEGIELGAIGLMMYPTFKSVLVTQGLNYIFKKAETGSFTGDKTFSEDLRDVVYSVPYTLGQDLISDWGKWDRSLGGGSFHTVTSYLLQGAGIGYLSIKGAKQSNTNVNPDTTYFSATLSGPIADVLGLPKYRKGISKLIQGGGNLGMYIYEQGLGAVWNNLCCKDAYGNQAFSRAERARIEAEYEASRTRLSEEEE